MSNTSETSDLDELRSEADHRRDAIARDVELVADRVSPSRIADRQKARLSRRVDGVRTAVFGHSDTSTNRTDTGGETLRDRASNALDTLDERSPDSVEEFTEGNPLAAGLIGLGLGLLAATLIPTTREEQRITDRAQRNLEDAAREVGRSGQQVAEAVKPTVEEAASDLKSSARDATDTVRSEAQDAARDLKDTAQERADDVRDN